MFHSQSDDVRTLFIGDLSVYANESDLQNLFSQFGPIEKITIKRGMSGTTNLSYGFVKFYTREAAEAATSMNGFMLMGRAIRIGRAGPRSTDKPIKVKEGPSRRDTAQIHVSFISKQVDGLITEETLRSLFSHYGKVVDVAIKKSKFDQNVKIQNGYGFIHFPLTGEGIQSALTATREVHQITVDRVIYDCTLSHLLESYLTPEQIAYAYSSPTPPAFRGRPYERKREMYSRKSPNIPPLYHAHRPAVASDHMHMEIDQQVYSSSSNSSAPSSIGLEETLPSRNNSTLSPFSSWDSATWSKLSLAQPASNESSFFTLDEDMGLDRLNISQLIESGEPSSPQTSSSAYSDGISDFGESLFSLPKAVRNSFRNEETFQPLIPMRERFNNNGFFQSWN